MGTRNELNCRRFDKQQVGDPQCFGWIVTSKVAILALSLLMACSASDRPMAVDLTESDAPSANQQDFQVLAGHLQGCVNDWNGEDPNGLIEIMKRVFTDGKIETPWARVAALATSRHPYRYHAAFALAAYDQDRASKLYIDLIDRSSAVDPGIAGTIIMWAAPTMQSAMDTGCTLMSVENAWARMTGHFILSMTTRLERGPNPRPFSILQGVVDISGDLWSDLCALPSPTPREMLERAWIESFRRRASGQATDRTREIIGYMQQLAYMTVKHPSHLRPPTDSEEAIRKYIGELNEVRWEHIKGMHHLNQLIPR
jgi:hypothetical protein